MFQIEVIDLQSSIALKHNLQSAGKEDFWYYHVNENQLPTVREVALQILTMFGSTYTCESSFSHLNAIKTKARCSLINGKLQECLRIAPTTYEPNYLEIAESRQ